jgi:hypothetical protein
MYLLESEDRAHTFKMTKVSTWEAGACVMSTAAFAQGDQKEFAAWESKGQVYLGTINPSSGRVLSTLSMPGEARGRKHPAVAANANGDVRGGVAGLGNSHGVHPPRRHVHRDVLMRFCRGRGPPAHRRGISVIPRSASAGTR